jgi:hypothetical protein
MVFWCLEAPSLQAPRFPSLFLPRSCFTYFRDQHWFADRPTHFLLHFRSNAHSHFVIAAISFQCWSRKYVKLGRGARSFEGRSLFLALRLYFDYSPISAWMDEGEVTRWGNCEKVRSDQGNISIGGMASFKRSRKVSSIKKCFIRSDFDQTAWIVVVLFISCTLKSWPHGLWSVQPQNPGLNSHRILNYS